MLDATHIDDFSDRMEVALQKFRLFWKANSSDTINYPEELEISEWIDEFFKFLKEDL